MPNNHCYSDASLAVYTLRHITRHLLSYSSWLCFVYKKNKQNKNRTEEVINQVRAQNISQPMCNDWLEWWFEWPKIFLAGYMYVDHYNHLHIILNKQSNPKLFIENFALVKQVCSQIEDYKSSLPPVISTKHEFQIIISLISYTALWLWCSKLLK